MVRFKFHFSVKCSVYTLTRFMALLLSYLLFYQQYIPSTNWIGTSIREVYGDSTCKIPAISRTGGGVISFNGKFKADDDSTCKIPAISRTGGGVISFNGKFKADDDSTYKIPAISRTVGGVISFNGEFKAMQARIGLRKNFVMSKKIIRGVTRRAHPPEGLQMDLPSKDSRMLHGAFILRGTPPTF